MTQLTTGLSDDSPFQREYAPQVEGKEKGNRRSGYEGPDTRVQTEPVYLAESWCGRIKLNYLQHCES